MKNTYETRTSLAEARASLPEKLVELIPELQYLEATNELHCNPEAMGGSKFLGINNVLEVVGKDANRIMDGLERRTDDRDALLAEGASPDAFLPAVKDPEGPEGLPEGLYYKIDGIRGKLAVIKASEIDASARVLVRREKSSKDENGKERVPCSYTVIQGKFEELPDTDFATVVIGREEGGKDAIWTIHPGIPVRPIQGDFLEGSESLPGPEEGKVQRIMTTTVAELLKAGHITASDYLKIAPGDFDQTAAQFEKA